MKKLVVYYSYPGQTKVIVDKISSLIDCDVVELKPLVPFGEYDQVVEEYQSNESDQKTVEIEDVPIDFDLYEKVIILTPVWWYTITPVMREFLTKYDLTGKEVYPIATNAGWLGRTFKEINSICRGNIHEGLSIKFSEDYHEKKILTSLDEIDNYIKKVEED